MTDMDQGRTAQIADTLVDLARLALAFGRIDRTAVYHPDGVTPESDTDHTVMLGWVACSLASRYFPLDVGLVAQFALIHDAPEVYAGDTPTLRITDAGRAQKADRERQAVDRLTREFGDRLPWFPVAIQAYERQTLPEARFVRAVDKLLPKLVHLLDGCAGLREHGMGPEELADTFCRQRVDLAAYLADLPELLDLHAELVERVLAHPGLQRPPTPVPADLRGATAGTGTPPSDPQSDGESWVSYSLDLPYERPPLRSNDNAWNAFDRAHIVRQVRQDVMVLGRQAGMRPGDHMEVQLHYAPGHNRRMDSHNLHPTVKACVDGLARGKRKDWVGLEIVPDDDDRYVTILPPMIHRPPWPGPRCWLRVNVRHGCPSESTVDSKGTPVTEVRVGQVWADRDTREPGRQVRVASVSDRWVHCTVIAPAQGKTKVGHKTKVGLDRMRRAYRLVSDVEGSGMSDVIRIDGARALALLREVVAGREDYVYLAPQGAPRCLYVHGTECGCLIGHVLHRAGATVEQLRQLDLSHPARIDSVRPHWLALSPDARGILSAAQCAQDRRDTWGEALMCAENVDRDWVERDTQFERTADAASGEQS